MTTTYNDHKTESLPPEEHPVPLPHLPPNNYLADHHLQAALARYYEHDPAGWAAAHQTLSEWGAVCAGRIAELYQTAERHGPVLITHDRRGERVDELEFHPAYHAIGRLVYGFGMAAMSNVPDWQGRGGPASQLLKFAAMFLYCQVEGSVSCPVSMTDILARVLNKYAAPQLAARYGPRLTSLDYDQLYTGAMFLTEKAGGSDVGATTTLARRTAEGWELSGDKWFCSNVGADLILTLARPEGAPDGTRGLGLFLVPRRLPDGRANRYTINRLKDKLGTRAMASGEVTFQNTLAYLIEPLERGFVMMMEMVNGTRLHSGVGGAGSLRQAVVEATLHARQRRTFGRALAEQPLMAQQLADLVVESEAVTSLALATAHALDRADASGASRPEKTLSRLLITLLKRYATSRGVYGAQTAMEVRGGNGYIEDWPDARRLRDAYVNIIWEGGINMVAFDALRALEREAAWPVYAGAIKSEMERAARPELAGIKGQLLESLAALATEVEFLAGQSREVQERAALILSETMAMLYAAAVRLAEVDFNLRRGVPSGLASLTRYVQRIYRPGLERLAARGYLIAAEAAGIIEAAVSP